MLCGGLLYRTFFLAAFCALTFPTFAHAAFEIVSHDAVADAVNRQTTFHVTFNQSPDFFTADPFGHPTNGFQFFYDAQPSDDEIDFAGEDVVIIRGVEIRVADDIPIRDSLNPSGEDFPNAEGWGAMRGAADFELDGATLTFTTSWETLNESDGVFGYRLFALEQGELTSEVTFLSRIIVPLPAPMLLGGLGLLITACACNRRI
jgi:hypothetical protein